MKKAYCGMNCECCVEHPCRCQGCSTTAGKPLWTSEFEDSVCPIYVCCVLKKQLSGCWECHEMICTVKEKL